MTVVFVVTDPIVKIGIHEKFFVKIIYVDFVLKDHAVHYHIQVLNYQIQTNLLVVQHNVKLSLFVIFVMKQVIKLHPVLNYLMKKDKNISICHQIMLKINNLIIDHIKMEDHLNKLAIFIIHLMNSIRQGLDFHNHSNMM